MTEEVLSPAVPKGVCPPEAEEKKGSGKGLALIWDNIPEVRQRLRTGHNLLVNFDAKLNQSTNTTVERTMGNVKVNSFVLSPVCQMMHVKGLTNIDDLESEVKQMFSMCGMLANTKTIIAQAWAIRYLIGVVKGSIKAEKGDKKKVKRCPKDRICFKVYISKFCIIDCFL
jgi:hypothetical protein